MSDSLRRSYRLLCSCEYCVCCILLRIKALTYPPPRRHLLHPWELHPAARCSHLWVGLHSGHPGLLRHLHLWVWHRHQWDHDGGLAAESPQLRGDHRLQEPGLNTGGGNKRPQVTRGEQHVHASQLYPREHSHVVALHHSSEVLHGLLQEGKLTEGEFGYL